MAVPAQKPLRLSLERPYKHESGAPIHDLLDITPEGIHIPDRPRDPDDLLADNVRRIFLERGTDFFDKNRDLSALDPHASATHERGDDEGASDDGGDSDSSEDRSDAESAMTTEELLQMRLQILQDLLLSSISIAQGELSHARDLLSVLLAAPAAASHLPPALTAQLAPSPATTLPSHAIAAAVVTQPEPIPSVRAFNAQLVVGGKDESLRSAAGVLRSAADALNKGQQARERYWVDALKLRRSNWALLPAPLAPGSALGVRGAERLATDFLISFGLEESPPAFRRRAVGQLPTASASRDAMIVFVHTARTRLRVTLVRNGRASHNSFAGQVDDLDTLDGVLRNAQHALVEHELFAALVREAGALPSVSARVSEQVIALEAASGTELRLELVSLAPGDPASTGPPATDADSATDVARCDLIRAALHLLLLRAHAHGKARRLADRSTTGPPPQHALAPPSILQPVLDTLQYEAFCGRVHAEVQRVADALGAAGVRARVRFAPAGETGSTLLRLVAENPAPRLSGEAVLRIDSRHTVRLTLLAPSTLTAHLPHATLQLTSISQLSQLLEDEVARTLLSRLRELGEKRSEAVGATWFVDELAGKVVGRWDGGLLFFRVTVKTSLNCVASHAHRDGRQIERTYDASVTPDQTLMSWASSEIETALNPGADITNKAPATPGMQLM